MTAIVVKPAEAPAPLSLTPEREKLQELVDAYGEETEEELEGKKAGLPPLNQLAIDLALAIRKMEHISGKLETKAEAAFKRQTPQKLELVRAIYRDGVAHLDKLGKMFKDAMGLSEEEFRPGIEIEIQKLREKLDPFTYEQLFP